tara:strand:- start:1993 stop:2262 length:270 start_codon:yes stop_codon:yes gene_type:complete
MKKLLYITLLLFVFQGCSLGINQLTSEVQQDIQNTYNQEQLGITVTSLVLTHEEGNYYAGVLETSEPDGEYVYNVEVIYDGNSFIWEVY